VLSCFEHFLCGYLMPDDNWDADAVWRALPLQHDLHRGDVMFGAKGYGFIAIAEIERISDFMGPTVQRFQVQEIIRILDQNFHTREIHVYS
jgi:hypothetical protein